MNTSDTTTPRPKDGKNAPTLRNSILVVVILAAAAVLLRLVPTLIGGEGSGRWTREFEEPVRQAEIHSLSCDVKIFPSEDGQCRVEYSGSRTHSCAAEMKNGTLTVTEKKRLPRIFAAFWGPDTKLTVYLPEGADLSLSTVSGDLILTGDRTAGAAAFESVSGDISIEDLRCGTLTVSTVSGEVELTDAAAEENAAFQAVSGDIALMGFEGGETVIETISGDVAAFDSDMADLDVSTTSGDVTLELLTGKDYDVSTVSGEVVAPSSDRTGGGCRVSTVSGDITVAERDD